MIFWKLRAGAGEAMLRAEQSYGKVTQRLAALPRDWRTVVLFVVLFATITRIGSLMHEVIDWDESTFVVIASSLSRGNLPYTTTWDVKPPFLFFYLSAFLTLFGSHLLSVRLAAMTCVVAISLSVFSIARTRHSFTASFLAAMITVAAFSVWDSQALYTEYLATSFLFLALALNAGEHAGTTKPFLTGMLISACILTRTNMFPLAFTFLIYFFAFPRLHDDARMAARWHAAIAYFLGGMIPFTALIFLYWHYGALDAFFFANVAAPMAYATNQLSPFLIAILALIAPFVIAIIYPDIWGIWLILIIWNVRLSLRSGRSDWLAPLRRFHPPTLSRTRWLIILSALGVYLGLCLNGASTWHHVIQIVPFLSLITPQIFDAVPRPRTRILAIIILIAASLRMAPDGVCVLVQGPMAVEHNYPIRQMAAKIETLGGAGKGVLALKGQLVYWYLNIDPPSKYGTHPSNFKKDFLLAGAGTWEDPTGHALPDILRQKPGFILTGDDPTERFTGALQEEILGTLADHYTVAFRTGGYVLYRRETPRPGAGKPE